MANDNLVLNELHIDMLKEVGHICTGNATIALSQVINQRVQLTIPDLKIVASNKVSEMFQNNLEILVGVNIQLLGQLSGNIVLMFPEKSAYGLIDGVSEEHSELGNATEFGVSILKEIGNIVISAYLATMSTFTQTVILHSTPSLTCGTLETILNIAFRKVFEKTEEIVMIETFFSIEKTKVEGSFFLMFEPAILRKLLDKQYIQTDPHN
ncbi:MAG: chemotaxis protein CheC [Candidatus Omnitrophota bacterium]